MQKFNPKLHLNAIQTAKREGNTQEMEALIHSFIDQLKYQAPITPSISCKSIEIGAQPLQGKIHAIIAEYLSAQEVIVSGTVLPKSEIKLFVPLAAMPEYLAMINSLLKYVGLYADMHGQKKTSIFVKVK